MYRAEDSAEEDHMGDESDDDSEEMCTEEQRTPLEYPVVSSPTVS